MNIEEIENLRQLTQNNLQAISHIKKRFESIDLDEYLSSFDQKIISERILELIIQAALDINVYNYLYFSILSF